MKSLPYSLAAIVLLAVWSMAALAQTPAADGKQLSKDGLSFNYPNGWTLVDESNADAQNFNIGRADNGQYRCRAAMPRAAVRDDPP